MEVVWEENEKEIVEKEASEILASCNCQWEMTKLVDAKTVVMQHLQKVINPSRTLKVEHLCFLDWRNILIDSNRIYVKSLEKKRIDRILQWIKGASLPMEVKTKEYLESLDSGVLDILNEAVEEISRKNRPDFG